MKLMAHLITEVTQDACSAFLVVPPNNSEVTWDDKGLPEG